MNANSVLHSEEDVKAKVISQWLANHGFGPDQISLEQAFEIRLGRTTKMIRPTKADRLRGRCDYLVRATDGRNLLIIETKAPDEALDDSAAEQAISYARALRAGGIAPFTIVTNGSATNIYDSINEELLNGASVSVDHPHVRNGFRMNVGFAILGAFLGEFISSSHGLGHLIVVASGLFDISLVLCAVFSLVAMALVLTHLLTHIEKPIKHLIVKFF